MNAFLAIQYQGRRRHQHRLSNFSVTQYVRLMTFSHDTEDGMEHDGWVLRIEDVPDAVLKAIGNGKTVELHAYKELEEVVRKKV